jgi:hypothetical protein
MASLTQILKLLVGKNSVSDVQLVAKKNGNCQNKIDTFLLWPKLNDILKNYVIGIYYPSYYQVNN